jgi:Cys-tRNA(Pro)/Cys-tRNA(Cys) deacylase
VSTPALAAADAAGLAYRVIRHGPVRSLAEAARARGVAPADVVKTLVVRRGQDDFLFVLVPGDRAISWPKLRRLLGVSRLSMPDAEVARQVTGYERGTITPFGSVRRWPVVADERVCGREITLGAGEHGLALAADADSILRALNASVADISDPEPATQAGASSSIRGAVPDDTPVGDG